jgi:hypothetical protein
MLVVFGEHDETGSRVCIFSVEQVCTISGSGTFSGFGHPQKKPTEIWEDNVSCIMISENPTNRDRSTHVDVKVHYLRDLVRDGHVKLVKCAGTQNVSDDLTMSLARPASLCFSKALCSYSYSKVNFQS